jgi:hypothetical protein
MRNKILIAVLAALVLAAGILIHAMPVGHKPPSGQQVIKQAQQSQAREIKGMLRPYCEGKPLGAFPLTGRQLARLCREWGLATPAPGPVLTSAVITATVPPPVVQCPVDANPCSGYQDNTSSKVTAITIWYDHLDQPVAEVSNAGGLKVFGDNITVYWPGSVSNPAVQLRPDGTILIGGQVITPQKVAFITCLMNGHTLAYCRTAIAARF